MISLFFYLLSSLLCVITANLIKGDAIKVIDLIHSNLPLLKVSYLSDFLVILQTVCTVTLLDGVALSEMFLIMGITQLCRVLCIASTVLPPLQRYEDKYRLGGLNGSGSEYIFSGHASYSAVSAIYLYTKGMASFLPLLIYNLSSQFLIVATRNHYTVDVILAWIIVPLVYGNVVLCEKVESCARTIDFVLE